MWTSAKGRLGAGNDGSDVAGSGGRGSGILAPCDGSLVELILGGECPYCVYIKYSILCLDTQCNINVPSSFIQGQNERRMSVKYQYA